MADPDLMSTISVSLRDIKPGKFHTLCKVTHIGSLQARRQAHGGILFFWRYSIGTISERVAIGAHALRSANVAETTASRN